MKPRSTDRKTMKAVSPCRNSVFAGGKDCEGADGGAGGGAAVVVGGGGAAVVVDGGGVVGGASVVGGAVAGVVVTVVADGPVVVVVVLLAVVVGSSWVVVVDELVVDAPAFGSSASGLLHPVAASTASEVAANVNPVRRRREVDDPMGPPSCRPNATDEVDTAALTDRPRSRRGNEPSADETGHRGVPH
jgi:hypothetical protein